jgi:phosphopantothenoylcysteine decarboxylase/phosphopantothenate--cysteine ligase
MRDAIIARAGEMHVVVMAAAVADYSPVTRAGQKVQKTGDELTLVMKKTPDILGELGLRRLSSSSGPLLVGFAAETDNVLGRAQEKRERKHVDLIVANDVSRGDAGFDVDTNAVTIIGAAGVETLPLQAKSAVAAEILNRVEKLLGAKAAPGGVRS